MGWGLRFSVSDKLSDNANVDGPSTTLGVARVLKLGWPLKHQRKLKKYQFLDCTLRGSDLIDVG